MVAFAIFGPRRVALFLGERALSSGCSGRIAVALTAAAVVVAAFAVRVVATDDDDATVQRDRSSCDLLDHNRGDEMRKEEATSARRW